MADWTTGDLLGAGAGLLGDYLKGQSAADAAQGASSTVTQAAQAAKFKPFGITTSFGQSGFNYDPSGNLIGAGYQLAPGVQEQLNTLFGSSKGLLGQFTGAPAAAAPLGQGAQSAMGLGQQYLGASPQEQATKWMRDQQDLLSASRASKLAGVRSNLNATGRTGLAIGGDAGMAASNPELQAYYNSIAQQDRDLAAQATQGGMDYAKFGLGMLGSGGDLLKSMYGTQTAAFDPYKTALAGSQALEGLGQKSFDLSTGVGAQQSTGASNTLNAQLAAANAAQQANAYNPWAGLLSGGASALANYKWGQ